MKNGGVQRCLAGSLLGTRQIYLCGAVSKDNPQIMDDEYVESIIAQLYELGSGQLFVDYALCDLDYARSQVTGRPMLKTLSSLG